MTATKGKGRGRPAGTRQPTAVERADHVQQVQQLMAAGVTNTEIVKWLTSTVTEAQAIVSRGRLVVKLWSVSAPTARRYIRLAWRGWFEEDRADENRERTRHRRRALLIFRKALEQGDLRAALKAEDMLARMDGAYLPAPTVPEDDDMISDDEAVDFIEHAHDTLEIMKRRGLLTEAQENTAIDVDAAVVAPAPEAVKVVDETGLVPTRPGGN